MSRQNENAASGEASQNRTSPTGPNAEERLERPKEDGRQIEALLGTPHRAPMYGLQSLTASQFRATGTPEEIPDYLSVSPGSFFSDGSSRRLYSGGESPLATALRSTGAAKATLEGSQRTADRKNNALDLKPNQGLSTAAANVTKLVGSVDWSRATSATVGLVIDKATSAAVEKVALLLTGVVKGPVLEAFTIAVDLATPTPISESPWRYTDRLSPSERREYYVESFSTNHLYPKEMPLDGPTLRNAY